MAIEEQWSTIRGATAGKSQPTDVSKAMPDIHAGQSHARRLTNALAVRE